MPLTVPTAAMLALAICNATQAPNPSTALIVAPSKAVQEWQPPLFQNFEKPSFTPCHECESDSVKKSFKTVAQKQQERSISNKNKMKKRLRNKKISNIAQEMREKALVHKNQCSEAKDKCLERHQTDMDLITGMRTYFSMNRIAQAIIDGCKMSFSRLGQINRCSTDFENCMNKS